MTRERTQADDQFLADVLPPERSPVTGRFLRPAGAVVGGVKPRKSHLNFVDIVDDFIVAHGGYTEDVIIDIFQTLMTWARLGDTQAAKILLERLCGKELDRIDVNVSSTLTDVERAQRLQAILETAQRRSANGEAPTTANRLTVN